MAGEYDYMTQEDRAQKIAEFESKRKAWISTRSSGIVRFVLFSEVLRDAIFVVASGVFYTARWHLNIAFAARVTVLMLLTGRVFKLPE